MLCAAPTPWPADARSHPVDVPVEPGAVASQSWIIETSCSCGTTSTERLIANVGIVLAFAGARFPDLPRTRAQAGLPPAGSG
jgi:hypothetical protein